LLTEIDPAVDDLCYSQSVVESRRRGTAGWNLGIGNRKLFATSPAAPVPLAERFQFHQSTLISYANIFFPPQELEAGEQDSANLFWWRAQRNKKLNLSSFVSTNSNSSHRPNCIVILIAHFMNPVPLPISNSNLCLEFKPYSMFSSVQFRTGIN
jgi:hypothetical protein